jgi:hypothetical protein
MMVDYEESFKNHQSVTKTQYCYPMGLIRPWCKRYDLLRFWLQMSLFKLIMKNNVALAMGHLYIVNPMICLRKSLAFSQMIAHRMLKYVKFGRNYYGPSD